MDGSGQPYANIMLLKRGNVHIQKIKPFLTPTILPHQKFVLIIELEGTKVVCIGASYSISASRRGRF